MVPAKIGSFRRSHTTYRERFRPEIIVYLIQFAWVGYRGVLHGRQCWFVIIVHIYLFFLDYYRICYQIRNIQCIIQLRICFFFHLIILLTDYSLVGGGSTIIGLERKRERKPRTNNACYNDLIKHFVISSQVLWSKI